MVLRSPVAPPLDPLLDWVGEEENFVAVDVVFIALAPVDTLDNDDDFFTCSPAEETGDVYGCLDVDPITVDPGRDGNVVPGDDGDGRDGPSCS